MKRDFAYTLAARMAGIRPFHVMEVQERAHQLEAQGRHIVHMEIGQPDFGAPPLVAEAAVDAIRRRSLGYTSSAGLPELREAISRHYAEQFGIEVPERRIIVTTGASGGLLLVLAALLDAGSEAVMADPGYPCNRNFVRLFDAIPRLIPVDEHSRYQLSADQLRAAWTPRTRCVALASPSNPTGTSIGEDALAAIMEETRRAGAALVVDEIYQGLVYGRRASSALTLADDVFVVNSFSKYFAMTGWRLGWIVAPEAYVQEIEKLAQNLAICPPVPSQYAALAAFEPQTRELLEERRREFEHRRDFLVPALRSLGFTVPLTPDGAFYIYAGCEQFGLDSAQLAMQLLEQAGVAITPGRDFGANRSTQHVRFAYTCSLGELNEGVEAVGRFLAHL